MDPAQKIDLPSLPYPEQKLKTHFGDIEGIGFTESQMRAYGEACARAAEPHIIAAFLERTGQYVTNDASREAAIDAAILADRERRGVPAGHVVVPVELLQRCA